MQLNIFHKSGGYLSDNKGVILVETAIIVPVLLLLLAGAIELGRYALAAQKLASLSSTAADLVAQAENGIDESEVNDIFAAAEFVSKPFDIVNDGRIIITTVIGTVDNGNSIAWQRCMGAASSQTSEIGSQGTQNVVLPANIELPVNDIAVVSEVFLSYEPLLFDTVVEPRTLSSSAMFRARFGSIETVGADDTPNMC